FGGILILGGTILQLNSMGITHITWSQAWPLFIIIAGVMLIIHSLSDKPSAENIEFISDPHLNSFYVFGGGERQVTAKDFQSAKLGAILADISLISPVLKWPVTRPSSKPMPFSAGVKFVSLSIGMSLYKASEFSVLTMTRRSMFRLIQPPLARLSTSAARPSSVESRLKISAPCIPSLDNPDVLDLTSWRGSHSQAFSYTCYPDLAA